MDAQLLIIVIVAVFVLTSGVFRPAPPPQIIYVQPVPAAPTSGGLGCLVAVVAFLVMLVLLGVVRL